MWPFRRRPPMITRVECGCGWSYADPDYSVAKWRLDEHAMRCERRDVGYSIHRYPDINTPM